jgi:hypothetical protein
MVIGLSSGGGVLEVLLFVVVARFVESFGSSCGGEMTGGEGFFLPCIPFGSRDSPRTKIKNAAGDF